MSIPLVTVLMPVYNAERFLRAAVESILAQTFDDFEFLIIDDGSTDSSLGVLRRFEAQDKRIRIISRPNTGYVIALNEMLLLARGRYIARMDADDISLRERLALQAQVLQSDVEIGAVGSSIDGFDFLCSHATSPSIRMSQAGS